mmetsp:Transcript_11698/g.38491  ORF Transcript_11698/g.38491 Transcript_11698/m.38491 type:complete len:244 (-) Transcript_11698:1002-1733(-)
MGPMTASRSRMPKRDPPAVPRARSASRSECWRRYSAPTTSSSSSRPTRLQQSRRRPRPRRTSLHFRRQRVSGSTRALYTSGGTAGARSRTAPTRAPRRSGATRWPSTAEQAPAEQAPAEQHRRGALPPRCCRCSMRHWAFCGCSLSACSRCSSRLCACRKACFSTRTSTRSPAPPATSPTKRTATTTRGRTRAGRAVARRRPPSARGCMSRSTCTAWRRTSAAATASLPAMTLSRFGRTPTWA